MTTEHSLRMLEDRIAVVRDDDETMLPCGLFLPDLARRKKKSGVVVAVGPGRIDKRGKRIPMTVKPGDRVIFGSYSGTEIKVGLNKYQIMRENDISCIIETDSPTDTSNVEVPTEIVRSGYIDPKYRS